jgi:hypothetical protein
MNWKQIIYTAIITLLVTIVSGVLVNWYTIKNINKSEKEEIVYDVKNISRFKSDSLNISLYTVVVSNIGDLKSEKISLKLNFNEHIDIIDLTSNLERTQENIEPFSNNNIEIAYKIPILFPRDNFTVSIALKNSIENPKVILQNNNIIGKPKTIDILEKEEKTIFKSKYLVALLITLLALFPILYLSIKKIFGYSQSLNNTAFLSIHNGQFELADKLLEKEISTNGGTTSELSNYGLLKFLQGKKPEQYEPLLRMAEFLSESRNSQKLVLSFNKFIIYSTKNEIEKSENEIEKLIKIDKLEFKKWYNYSHIISDMKKSDNELNKKLLAFEKKYFA